MVNFEKIRFKGTFRDYQQRVLDRADGHWKDGKIHIVAAPGSGKTVLGLELIRRLCAPCLILAPTTAIREQWGERFKTMFLEREEDFSVFFSNDLHDVKLLTAVTYQALYSAVEKISSEGEDDENCADVEIFSALKDFGIRTICLDEAHHLKNEWQKALEKFISSVKSDVKIISLTATPPYDAEGAEWNRYTELCGEIDEEIFVPELVGQNALCPHQDYVYFNYPTKAETERFTAHKENAVLAVKSLGTMDVFSRISAELNEEKDYDILFSDTEKYIALFTLLRHYGFSADKKLIRALTAKKGLPSFRMEYAEKALQFLLDGEWLSAQEKSEIMSVLKQYGVYEKRKVTLVLTERLKRTLVSSAGKLKSIKSIVGSEISCMGERLRMLILTDYIKKESLSQITEKDDRGDVNVVSIFETVRRAYPDVKIGVLSGTLVILPKSVDLSDVKHKKADIPNTDYREVSFSGGSKCSVAYVGNLFERGELQILVGTKSLLGEGWDSPCINSLILASFVGSFVLSNQMRGRAIRVDRNDSEKTSNIWHLVTVEPEYLFKEKAFERFGEYIRRDEDELISYDYEVLKRRFDSFMGPNYTTGRIESGIERLSIVRPPYDKSGIANINEEMLALSAKRGEIRDRWKGEVADGSFSVEIETNVPKQKRVPVFTFWNFALSATVMATQISLLQPLWRAVASGKIRLSLGLLAVTVALSFLLYHVAKKMAIHSNPAKSIRVLGMAVYQTLCECSLIASSAKPEVTESKTLSYVSLSLRNASVRDQNIFNTAMAELLSPIDNPRYLLIAKNAMGRYDYALSFACPSVIGKKKEYAEILTEKLKKSTGNFEPVYTRREDGRRLILKCRKYSYITVNEKAMGKKYTVSHWE